MKFEGKIFEGTQKKFAMAVRFSNRTSFTLVLLGISGTRPASQSSIVITRSLGLGLRKIDEFL